MPRRNGTTTQGAAAPINLDSARRPVIIPASHALQNTFFDMDHFLANQGY